MLGQFKCNVDLVLCIDATGSMSPIIDDVKQSAKGFYSKLVKSLAEKDRETDVFRIKVIVFRDYYCDGKDSMIVSDFFTLPTQTDEFDDFVSSIKATGGGDEPESALEAIALAMKSDWNTEGAKKRHVIMVWTDASAHKLEKAHEDETPVGYPQDIPTSFGEFCDSWSSSSQDDGLMDYSAKRLILFTPNAYPWNTIGEEWENTVWEPSRAGEGLGDVDIETVLKVLAGSI